MLSNPRTAPYHPPYRRVSPVEMEDRRLKGLYFLYDEKYTFSHKCANMRLFLLILEPMEEAKEVEEIEGEEVDNEPIISLHALHGVRISHNNQTMRLVRYYRKRRLHVLVDSRSTHNVLNLEVAKRIGCRFQPAMKHRVIVANGDKLIFDSICSRFKWIMQGHQFEASVLLMPLKGCKLILGME